jgi:hypothetical protein
MAQVSMEVSAGKLEGIRGGSSGFPSVSQALLGVVALLLRTMDVWYCGSGIGKAGRMCSLSSRTVASHRENQCWEAKRRRLDI